MPASLTPSVRKARSTPLWQRSLLSLARKPVPMTSFCVMLAVLLVAVFAPQLAPYDPTKPDFLAVRKAPSAEHILGTDDIGRDVLSRLIFGARASLAAGALSVLVAMALGVPLGIIAGYYGGTLGELIMRVTDALLAFPFLILAVALAAAFGPSLMNAMIAIGIASAPTFVRLARGQVLAVRTEEYVQAARALGAKNSRILVSHVLPNSLAPLLVQGTLTIATSIIAESSLSFLGLGVQPPTPSWGGMLNVAKNFMSQAPWMAVWPGVAIFVTVLAFNLFGDGVRDALDPRD